LVNAAHAKNVTGRKKNDTDAIWLQKLHSCGLLQKSFQPEEEIRVLRTYVRQRKNLITICSDSVRRMQKALEYIAEVGYDMSKWKTPKRFAAWNNVVPNNKITGEKVIRSALMKKKNKAGQCLRMATSTLWHDRSPLGDYYRIHRAKCGGKGAVVVTAHKMSRMIFIMLRDKVEYNPDMLTQAQQDHTQRRIKQMERQLRRLKTIA